MAEKNYTSKLTLDASGFNKTMAEINSLIKANTSEIKLLKDTSGKYDETVKALDNNLFAHQQKLTLLENKYQELIKAQKEGTVEANKIKAQINEEKLAVQNAEKAIKNYNAGIKESKGCNEDFCKSLTAMQMAVYDLAKTIGNIAIKALSDFTQETINTGITFETAFTGLKKVVDGTDEEINKLKDDIIDMSSKKPISADTIASLYQAGSQLGIAKDDLGKFTDVVTNLATTTNLTTDAAATMIAQYANVTHLKSDDYERFGSVLFKLGSTTATTELDIMNLASRISGTGALIGMADKDILALSASLGSVGISAESGGSAISTVLTKIDTAVDKNGQDLQEWAKIAGMSAEEFKTTWKGDIMTAIQAVIKGMGDTKKNGESLNILLEEMGIKNIRQTDTLKKLAGASDLLSDCIDKANKEWETNTALVEGAEKFYGTTENKIKLLSNQFDAVKISIYDNLKTPINEAIESLSKLAESDSAKKFADEFAKVIKTGMDIAVGAIKIFVENFDKIVAAVKIATPLIVSFFAQFALNSIKKQIETLIPTFMSWITQIKSATTAQGLLNAVMSANPIGLVCMALGTAVSAYQLFSSAISDSTQKMHENEQAVLEQKKAYEEAEITRQKTLDGIDIEYGKYEDLIKEFKTLVDENGNVKKGYEDRIKEIIPQIEKATGTEIKCIDGQIQEYKQLISTIEDVIASKKMEARIGAYTKFASEATENELKLTQEGKDLDEQIRKKKEELATTPEKVMNGKGDSEYTNDEWLKKNKELQDLEKAKQEKDKLIADYKKSGDDYWALVAEEQKKQDEYNASKKQTQTTNNVNGTTGTTTEKVTGTERATTEKEEEQEEEIDFTKKSYNELLDLHKEYQSKLKTMREKALAGDKSITAGEIANKEKELKKIGEAIESITGENPNKKKKTTSTKTKTEDTITETYEELIKTQKECQTKYNDLQTKWLKGLASADEVQNAKKALDEVNKKLTTMGVDISTKKDKSKNTTITTEVKTINTTEDLVEDESYGALVKKEQDLKEKLAQMQSDLADGNENITNDMLSSVQKQIDQVHAKIKKLKDEWNEENETEDGDDGEISDEFESADTNHISSGVILGEGVAGKQAIEMNGVGRDAAVSYLEGYKEAMAEDEALKAEQALEKAQAQSLIEQEATLSPDNLEIQKETQRVVAEEKQTAQAQGLDDNAYKVVDAEINTMDLAKNEALAIDFTCVGLHICESIAAGIRANAGLIIDAVRDAMEAAQDAADDEDDVESPSKVYYEHGMYNMLGLANGIKDYTDTASNAMKNSMKGVQSQIDDFNFSNNGLGDKNNNGLNNSGSQVIYNFTQNNTSNKSLDTLSIYQQSQSLLKRSTRDIYV